MTRRPEAAAPPRPLRLVPAPGDAAEPAPRPARIARARERIRTGYYERPEVTRVLVDALLAEFAAAN